MTNKKVRTTRVRGKSGSDYINDVRFTAILASADNATVLCQVCGVKAAEVIAMHRCGAPAGVVCEHCLSDQRRRLDRVALLATAVTYCEHCNTDVDRTHLYVLSLFDSTKPEEGV